MDRSAQGRAVAGVDALSAVSFVFPGPQKQGTGHPQLDSASTSVPPAVRLTNGRMFVNMSPGTSDGIRCDVDGNVWSAAGWAAKDFNGVHVFAPDGTLIGKIHLPETCANLFGGTKRNRLFMTASQSLYALYVETRAPGWLDAKIFQSYPVMSSIPGL